jgi:hypothetical protein
MPLVGFEPTIPAFEQAKTVHALNSAATAIGVYIQYIMIKTLRYSWCHEAQNKLLIATSFF